MLHHPNDLLGPRGSKIAEGLVELRSSGLVSKIGISVYRPCDLDSVMRVLKLDLIQLPVNVFDRRFEKSGWLIRLASEGIEIHARSIFLQGLLLMKPDEVPDRFAPWSKLIREWHAWSDLRDSIAVEKCIAHVNAHQEFTRLVFGCDNLNQLKPIVQAFYRLSELAPERFACADDELINPSTWGDE